MKKTSQPIKRSNTKHSIVIHFIYQHHYRATIHLGHIEHAAAAAAAVSALGTLGQVMESHETTGK